MKALRTTAAVAAAFASTVVALATAATAAGAPSVIAMNQKISNGEVAITYANLPKDGFLVLHSSDASGKVGSAVIGEVPLQAGDQRNIKVKVDGTVAAGSKVWAELQPAKDGNRAFTDAGLPVEQSFKVL